MKWASVSERQQVKLLAFPGTAAARAYEKARALVISDPRSQRTLGELERIAPTGASVLIVGETGTGKERAARHIHEYSGVSGPFVALNCAALSEGLVDAELFGHEPGAFTGALHGRPGWFEAANGGTLFLDEIGDMPLPTQLRLLRVLQERQVVRIGSRTPVPIDVRIIAATNVQLEPAVEARKFRRDLYYRLNVAAVKLLPLRERRGDILPLAEHFLQVYRMQLNLERAVLTAAAEQALLAHAWPGNIRELENVIQVSLILNGSGIIDAADLRLAQAAPGRAVRGQELPVVDTGRTHGGDDELSALGAGLRRLLSTGRQDVYQEVERLLLTAAFEHCAGNQVQTAKRLGVSRNVVRAQLKRFGLLGNGYSPR